VVAGGNQQPGTTQKIADIAGWSKTIKTARKNRVPDPPA